MCAAGLLDCNIATFTAALTEVFDMAKQSAYAAASARAAKGGVARLSVSSGGGGSRSGGRGTVLAPSPPMPIPVRGAAKPAAGGAGDLPFASSFPSSYNGEFDSTN